MKTYRIYVCDYPQVIEMYFFHPLFPECDSQCSEDVSPMDVSHTTLTIGTLVPYQKASPERRITQKEIIAGEERPKFLTIKQLQEAQG